MTKTYQFTQKILTLVLAAALIMAMAATTVAVYLSPSGYISLDVNPSVEIETNRFGKVISVKGINDDAKKLLTDYKLKDHDLDDVVENIVDRMISEGYISESKKNDILITVDDPKMPEETLKKVNKKVASYLEKRSLKAQIVGQQLQVNDKLLENAHNNNISVGKMALIEQMNSISKDLTVDNLADMRISDLLTYAQDKNISLGAIEEYIDFLDDDKLDNLEDEIEDEIDKNDVDDDDDEDLDDIEDLFSDDDEDEIDDEDQSSQQPASSAGKKEPNKDTSANISQSSDIEEAEDENEEDDSDLETENSEDEEDEKEDDGDSKDDESEDD